MLDLRDTTLIVFEVGNKCNLAHLHEKCPINDIIESDSRHNMLTVDKIIQAIDDAEELNFKGHIGFHHYNEPLMELDKIIQVIELRPNKQYLLWTNGLLLNRDAEKNRFMNFFNQIMITCYDVGDMPFFEKIKERYKKVQILQGCFDDRHLIYESEYKNELACKRILYELPIDHFGNVKLCCVDWKRSHEIGNINESGLAEIIKNETYQKLLSGAHKRLLHEDAPELCKRCKLIFVKYYKGDDGFSEEEMNRYKNLKIM